MLGVAKLVSQPARCAVNLMAFNVEASFRLQGANLYGNVIA
jgi:hypothetical protein